MRRFAMPTIMITMLLTIILCVGPGCGKKASEVVAERAIENAMAKEGQKADVDIDSNGGSFTMKTDGGASVAYGKGAKAPDGFPKDIPIYPGAEIQMSSADPSSKTYMVQAISADAIDKVAEYYKKEMKANGWNEGDGVVQTGANPMHMLNFDKDAATAMIMVMAQEGKSLLSITTEQE